MPSSTTIRYLSASSIKCLRPVTNNLTRCWFKTKMTTICKIRSFRQTSPLLAWFNKVPLTKIEKSQYEFWDPKNEKWKQLKRPTSVFPTWRSWPRAKTPPTLCIKFRQSLHWIQSTTCRRSSKNKNRKRCIVATRSLTHCCSICESCPVSKVRSFRSCQQRPMAILW